MLIKNYIVDTNVFIAANGQANQLDNDETEKCKTFVADLFANTIVSIDSNNEIFSEYFNHMSRSGQPGIGDAYVKYLWDNQQNKNICELVKLEQDIKCVYVVFLEKSELLKFDKNDLKFIAVSFASKYHPVICNACDSDWKINYDLLKKYNVEVLQILHNKVY